jgi:Na+/proline symporter
MLHSSVDSAQLYSGIIYKNGISGLWILWAGLITAAVVPIVFAPLWAKLDFITDNQFILYRFSGRSARILHQFRAVYVGGIVVTFSLSFQTIAFSRILQIFFDLTTNTSLGITGGLLVLFALKNSFANKFKTDLLHSFIYIASLIISFFFLKESVGGFENVLNQIADTSPERLSVFPSSNNHQLWYALFVYLGVQWWSTSLFDGGGPDMARYTAPGSRWGAIKVGLTPVAFNIIVVLVLVMISLMSIVNAKPNVNGELLVIEAIFQSVPHYLSPLILLGFFALFITSAESVMNWGASFLTVDFYKGYLVKNQTPKHYARISFLMMVSLSALSLIAALYIDSLETLIKITFSISAGVAPVFALRWFWLRINAWSQLSAMLSSGVYTLIFYILQGNYEEFFKQSVLQPYEWRMIIVTILTTITWVVVTLLTPKDNLQTLERFKKVLPTRNEVLKSFAIAFLVGLLVLFVTVSCVYLVVI